MKYYIGIDLGGTNIAAGVVTDRMQLLQSTLPSPWRGVHLKRLWPIWPS